MELSKGISTSWCVIQNKGSEKCITVLNAYTSNYTDLIQYTRNDKANQLWMIAPAGDGSYYIANQNSGLLVTVLNASTDNDANIIQYEYHDCGTKDDNSRWYIEQDSDGYYYFRSKSSGKVMTILNASMDNDARIIQYEYVAENWNCLFNIVPVKSFVTDGLDSPEFNGKYADEYPQLTSNSLEDYLGNYQDYALVARTLIPFFRVTDDEYNNMAERADKFPVYILDVSYRFAKDERWFTYSTQEGEDVFSYTITTGASESQTQEISVGLGISMTATAGVEGVASASVTVSVDVSYTESNTLEVYSEESIQHQITVPYRYAGAFWSGQRQLVLKRMDDSIVNSWEVTAGAIYTGTYPQTPPK